MKYVKILGLLAVAAAALMAFVGTASAAKVTSPQNTKYFGQIHAESEGYVVLHPEELPDVTCNSTVKGEVSVNDPENGNPTTKASGPITELNFSGCTNGYHATTNAPGTLLISSLGGGKGTLYSTGTTVTVTRFGVECRYLTNTTDIGEVTGTQVTGGNATLDIKAKIPFHSGSFLCGEEANEWTGSYKVTTPASLWID